MTITFLDLYNKVTGQAWSMFDGEIEDQEEFETTVTTSIQKALSALWCEYKFPFRYKTKTLITKSGKSVYDLPSGNIVERSVGGNHVYGVVYNKKFLPYLDNYELLEEKEGEPQGFYVKNDSLYLYPTPDNRYSVNLEYLSIFAAVDKDGIEKANLVDETDLINIPEKYEDLFEKTLWPLAMMYLIAQPSDENYPGYEAQYKVALKNLIEFTRGINIKRRISW